MKQTPFIYGNIVSEKAFTNRENERKKLYSNLISGINTMIISPRRWGKSSLVAKVFKEIEKENSRIKIVNIDLFAVNSEEEFLEVFAKEIIKASSTKWEDWAKSGKDFFKQLVPKISFGVDPVSDFSLSFDWSELRKNRNEILNLPETIAIKRKIKFIVGLDEFQNLSTFPEYKIIEKRMRAVWQRQKLVTFCIYGSKRHMMSNIFDNSANPFYRFGDIILLQKIRTDKWVNYIYRGFKRTNKRIEKSQAKQISMLMKNHPWYVQQLSHYTWNLTNDVATENEIVKALEELINTNSPLYQQEIEQLGKTQLNLLKAIARNEKYLSSVNVLQKYQLGTSRNVSKNKKNLINKDMILKTDEGFELLDPAFELWFKKQFLNNSLYNYL
ncbi:MAG: ATP-binding protein [Ignavibacteriae bacterium]|nr:ATP-binding protein [Ignavibacteriota bacterium]